MIKRNFIAAVAFAAIIVTSHHTSVIANDADGYMPLYWNGPAGYDHNVLFDKPNKYLRYRKNRCNYFGRK